MSKSRSHVLSERTHFDAISTKYYDIVDKLAYDVGYYHQEELAFMANVLSNRNAVPLKILDAGCGPGRHSTELAKLGHEIISLDFSSGMLQQTKTGLIKSEVFHRVKLVQGDVRYLPFTDYSFDVVICMEVLEHLPGYLEDAALVITEFARILKDGGQLIIEFPLRFYFDIIRSHPEFHPSWRELTPEEWEIYKKTPLETNSHFDESVIAAMLAQRGFSVESMRYIRVLPAGLIEKYPFLEYFDQLLEKQPETQKLSREIIWLANKLSTTMTSDREWLVKASAQPRFDNKFMQTLLMLHNLAVEKDQQLAAERQAHEQTHKQLIAVGDELVQERQQLAAERQAHNETLSILQEIYASLGWQWLQRYRRFRKVILRGTNSERWNYFNYALQRSMQVLMWKGWGKVANLFHVVIEQNKKDIQPRGLKLPISVRSFTSKVRGKDIIRNILDAHSNSRGFVVYPPTIDWNYPLLQRPHHIALGLAEHGYVFLHITPNLYDKIDGAAKIYDAVYIINLPPESFHELPKDKTVLYISYSANYLYSKLIPHKLIIYDYLDAIDLSDIPDQEHLILHTAALKNADIVLATAKNLYNEAKKLTSKVILCPNGVEYNHFHRDVYIIPADLQHLLDRGKPIIGYYGALAKWFDYQLLRICAMEYPEWEFVLIGLDYDKSLRESSVTAMPNVHYLGSRSYQVLPHYLHGFSVATIPFCLNKTTLSTNPIKLFEYMAGKKPIVTTALSECQGYRGVLWSQDQTAYLENLGRAFKLSKDEAYLSLQAAEARENSWDKRIQQIVAELSLLGL